MPSLVSGYNSRTAAASRCAGEWRYTSSASGFLLVRISRLAFSSMGRVRSKSVPFTLATMAASARRGLIDLAISMGRVPAATDCLLPSGRVISMLLIGNFQRNTPGLLGDQEGNVIAFLAIGG